jgi:uncharacterized SAM-binding protein YcdF (DUF218 family)
VLLLTALLSKNVKKKRIFLLSSVILLYVFSNGFLQNEVMRLWELKARKYQSLNTYDAGIVLGGMLWYDQEFDRLQFSRSTDRVVQAIELYKKGYIRKIVFTGGSGSILHQDMKEGVYAKRFLLTMGIPEEDILIESESNNTRENAVFTKELLDKEIPQGKFLLLTSAFHMRRSIACFENVGMQLEYYSTDRYSGPRKFEFDHLFIPNSQAFEEWKMLIHEIVGFCVYKIAGFA